MKAVRGNKEYAIDESQKKAYTDRGYDIHDDDGSIVAYGRGKTVPYDDYEKVVRENTELKEQISRFSDTGEADADKSKPSGKNKTKEDAAAGQG